MAASSQKIISILGGIFLAVVVVSIAVIWFLPATEETDVAPIDTSSPSSTGQASPDFNTAVLRRPEYAALNQQTVSEGAVPVQPPAVIGKANPFL